LFWPQREAIAPDADGNLTSDSLWTNRWDAENRRTVIESRAGLPPAAQRREQWTLLPDGRWIERIVSTNNGTAYFPAFTNRYVWDGQVLLAVLDGENHPVVTLMRGLDLSGTMQGAGGVGGLVGLQVGAAGPVELANTTHFACIDGNGNVMALVNAADGTESARYEYGPFGELLRATGPLALVNPLGFSTQYRDDVTGDWKYLHRDLDADTGRWLNRDPIGEFGFRRNHGKEVAGRNRGELNPYGFVRNSPLFYYDLLGLYGNPVSGPSGPVGPSSPYAPGGAYYVPNNTDGEGSVGIGFYFLFGADFSLSVGTCCENGTRYRYTILTACGGLGGYVGLGKGKLKLETPSGTGSSLSYSPKDSACPPQVRHYVAATASVGPVEVGAEFVDEGDAIEGVAKPALPPSVGVKYAICSDTVISKKAIGCCAAAAPVLPPRFPPQSPPFTLLSSQ
jgi:RHS repeat-associated protein